MNNLSGVIKRFDQAKVLIVGDVMLDKYTHGKTERISPEAPVQVVEVDEEKYFLGGAANVARNIASVGGKVKVLSVVGNDRDGKRLEELLENNKISHSLIKSASKPTTKKVRIISHNQQLIRIDYEDNSEIIGEEKCNLKDLLKAERENFKVLIVSDYAKGVINQEIFDYIISLDYKIVLDPKPRKSIQYHDVFLTTPNLKEARALVDIDQNDFKAITKSLSSISKNVLLTLGEEGMALLEGNNYKQIRTYARQVYDVSGAGDTVIGLCAAALSVDTPLEEAAEIANFGAGIVVGRVGTATTTPQELTTYIEEVNQLKINV